MPEKEFIICRYLNTWYCNGVEIPKKTPIKQLETFFDLWGYPEIEEIPGASL